jgi:threonine/homoserine/homoserine lactone efflux protein
LTVSGLVAVIIQTPQVFNIIRWAGAVFLFVIGCLAIRDNSPVAKALDSADEILPLSAFNSMRSGFLIALLNPKLPIFFIALFSQYVSPNPAWQEKMILVGTVTTTDGLWYCLIALVVGHAPVLRWLRRYTVILNKVFGVILMLLAIRIIL